MLTGLVSFTFRLRQGAEREEVEAEELERTVALALSDFFAPQIMDSLVVEKTESVVRGVLRIRLGEVHKEAAAEAHDD